MALEFVGGAVFGFSGTATGTHSLTSLTGGLAAAPIEGDIVVVAFTGAFSSGSAPVLTVTGNNSGSYAAVAGSPVTGTDSVDATLSVFYAVQGATPDTEISRSGLGLSSRGGAIAVHVWRGVDPDVPLDVTPTTATADNIGRPTPAGITPVTEGAVAIASGSASASTNFTSGDLDNFITVFGSATIPGLIGCGSRAWAGSGAMSFTQWGGGTTSTSASWSAITIALRPEGDPAVNGEFDVQEDDDDLAGVGRVAFYADLAVQEESDTALSAGVTGAGVIGFSGDASILEEDDALAAEADVSVIGTLALVEDADAVLTFGISGSLGPFTRRPIIWLN